MDSKKYDHFYLNPKDDFKPINVTEIDKKILAIQIKTPDDELPVESYKFDFSNLSSPVKRPKFAVNNFAIDNLKINWDGDDEEYEKVDILKNLDLMRPFQYSGIKINDNQKYERVMQLTPSKEWPKISFLNDEKFKL